VNVKEIFFHVTAVLYMQRYPSEINF